MYNVYIYPYMDGLHIPDLVRNSFSIPCCSRVVRASGRPVVSAAWQPAPCLAHISRPEQSREAVLVDGMLAVLGAIDHACMPGTHCGMKTGGSCERSLKGDRQENDKYPVPLRTLCIIIQTFCRELTEDRSGLV